MLTQIVHSSARGVRRAVSSRLSRVAALRAVGYDRTAPRPRRTGPRRRRAAYGRLADDCQLEDRLAHDSMTVPSMSVRLYTRLIMLGHSYTTLRESYGNRISGGEARVLSRKQKVSL